MPPADVVAVLGSYTTRVRTPRGSTAVCGLELMSALRPPAHAVKDAATGSWVSGPNPGSPAEPVDPAPPEAPVERPLVAALHPRHHVRTPDQVIGEEAYDRFRPLTDEECTQGYTRAVGTGGTAPTASWSSSPTSTTWSSTSETAVCVRLGTDV
ncbi:hypothetical protein OG754_38590 [Streptomyces decoyicus]|uniref:hypothetical protein n=1 Tax=Streptomyces decoyicus TaxID=249567 RepID=UPI002E361E29|nr:hypothetical protein [Streptomyces decoyicus]